MAVTINSPKRAYAPWGYVPNQPFEHTKRMMETVEVIYFLKKHKGIVILEFSLRPKIGGHIFQDVKMHVAREHAVRFIEELRQECLFYCFVTTGIMTVTMIRFLKDSHTHNIQPTSAETIVSVETIVPVETTEVVEDTETMIDFTKPIYNPISTDLFKFLDAEQYFYALGHYPEFWDPSTPIHPETDKDEILELREAAYNRFGVNPHDPDWVPGKRGKGRPKKEKVWTRKLSDAEFDRLSDEDQESYAEWENQS